MSDQWRRTTICRPCGHVADGYHVVCPRCASKNVYPHTQPPDGWLAKEFETLERPMTDTVTVPIKRSELALRLLAAFNGVDELPPGHEYHSNPWMFEAWERVAAVVLSIAPPSEPGEVEPVLSCSVCGQEVNDRGQLSCECPDPSTLERRRLIAAEQRATAAEAALAEAERKTKIAMDSMEFWKTAAAQENKKYTEARAENERLSERVSTLERLDREAASHVESVICMRTHFTGDPPYAGWKGLGLALTETLDERDRLRSQLGEAIEVLTPFGAEHATSYDFYSRSAPFRRARDFLATVLGEREVCSTCSGQGTIDERIGGQATSNSAATCPDCGPPTTKESSGGDPD